MLPEPTAYVALALTAAVDCYLLLLFFTGRRADVAVKPLAAAAPSPPGH